MLSRFPRRADAAAFLVAALLGIGLGGAAVVGSLGAVGRTFPGFVVWDDLVVVALGRPGWTGVAAGVPYRGRLVAVDGATARARSDVLTAVRAAPPGTPHRYGFIARDGTPSERTVASMVLGFGDWVATMGVYAVNGLAFLLTGLAVFWLRPDAPPSRGVLAFGTIWGLTLLLAADLFTTGRLQRVYFVCEALSPAAILHLALVFPESRRRRRGVLAATYAAALAVGLVQATAFHRDVPLLLAVNDAVYLAIAAAGVAALASLAWAALRSPSPIARRRARVVLAGAMAAFGIPLVALLAFFLLDLSVSFSLLTLTGFLFPLSIGWAVVRHDLFEADRLVKRALAWATLTALLALAYGATVLVAERLAAGVAVRQSPLFPIAFVLLALATIVPLRDRLQRGLDRLFARGRVSYKEAVAAAAERMPTLLARDAVVAHVVGTMRDTLFLDGASLWERDADGLQRRDAPAPRVAAGDPGLDALDALARPLSRDEVEESPRLRDGRPALRALLAACDASLVVPLVREGRVAGLLGVAGTASGRPLSADDLDVLRTLASEAAVALGTAAAIEQLEAARARLARAEQLAAIGELSAAVAHGIRNPLAGIRLAAQLGREHVPPEDPVRESLDDVLSEVDRLEAQVRGILDFARPFEPSLEALPVAELLRDAAGTATARLRLAGVSVAVEVPPGLPDVRGDRAHLGQVLQELLGNAADATPAGGRVTLAAAADGPGRVRLSVADTGPGIPPEVRDRVFQLFMTTKSTGTGVGLAVVRKIVERHGGRVRLEHPPEGGARFVLDLPAA